MANATKAQVLKAWSEKAGREDAFDLRNVTSADGTVQTQLINKDNGSLVVAADGENAFDTLLEQVGTALIDAGVNPKEASEDNEVEFTSEGALATPTQPEAIEGVAEVVEVDNKADRK